MKRIFRNPRSKRNRRSHVATTDQGSAAIEAVPKTTGRGRRLWVILLICLVGSGLASFVFFKYVIGSGIPSELVGTWQVIDGPLRGATLEFRLDGTAVAVMTKRGKTETTHSRARVDGKKIFLTDKDDVTGKEETVIQSIITLTEEELTLRDEDKNTYNLKRVRK